MKEFLEDTFGFVFLIWRISFMLIVAILPFVLIMHFFIFKLL
jgi:hypothetical protein